MRNFTRIGDIDPTPVVLALSQHPELWNQHDIRTKHPGTAHSQVDDILVFFNDLTNPEAVVDDRQTIEFPAWRTLPQLRPIIFDLMRRLEAVQLGRVIISRLAPGKTITPHVDGGAPATWYTRVQVALQSLPGCVFAVGDESLHMPTGSVWAFDNTQTHSVVNNSEADRLAIIIDVRTA